MTLTKLSLVFIQVIVNVPMVTLSLLSCSGAVLIEPVVLPARSFPEVVQVRLGDADSPQGDIILDI